MKQTFAYATALLLAFGSAAYAQGGGAVGGAGGTSGGSTGGPGSKSGAAPTGAQSDTRLPHAPNSITARNRMGTNSPLPGQPGNPQTGPIRR
jgi:hypothetical protein